MTPCRQGLTLGVPPGLQVWLELLQIPTRKPRAKFGTAPLPPTVISEKSYVVNKHRLPQMLREEGNGDG